MAVRTTERPEATHTSRVSSVSSQFSDGPMPSPSARSSTSSWSEEPVQPNMDISTGHMVLGESVQEKRSIHTALDGCDPAQHEGLLSVRTWPLRLPEQGGSSSPFAQLSASARGSYELKLTLGVEAGTAQCLSEWPPRPPGGLALVLRLHRRPLLQAYMEDHLKNKNRLEKEWEALCAYQAEPNSSLVAQREENLPKNRCPAVLTYDHSRVRLKSENSHSSSDYINASPIMDHDPRKPAYIATQGPLPSTVADFWQMVWESGCVVVVMLTPLSESGVRQCCHYWPDEGSSLYHIYEVHLVSEHIWCEDFLVRSFYLKNLQTNETRTVTQFHFLSWYDQGVPSSTRSLLDFRSDGAGRSGTYVLIDMVLNKMAKDALCVTASGRLGSENCDLSTDPGHRHSPDDHSLSPQNSDSSTLELSVSWALCVQHSSCVTQAVVLGGAKEIDIAATLEHLRDQRPGMVQTKEQFEFALTAVAEEVNAILKAFPQ
ncbi:hypothetical protein MJT46_006404 [Ovis ammon polii x Ovis aries]|nr:hypothetical protein MJT46_006404 [Ovis ammon polii x Ovis aries]